MESTELQDWIESLITTRELARMTASDYGRENSRLRAELVGKTEELARLQAMDAQWQEAVKSRDKTIAELKEWIATGGGADSDSAQLERIKELNNLRRELARLKEPAVRVSELRPLTLDMEARDAQEHPGGVRIEQDLPNDGPTARFIRLLYKYIPELQEEHPAKKGWVHFGDSGVSYGEDIAPEDLHAWVPVDSFWHDSRVVAAYDRYMAEKGGGNE